MTDDSDSPYRGHRPPRKKPRRRGGSQRSAKAHEHSRPHPKAAHTAKRSKSTRRRGRAKAKGPARTAQSLHTSHPTTRGAQMDTRAWLLRHYGPICAYCGEKFNARKMTLDHVAPRRGQTAYDRRDNLVLACVPCNQAKKDQAPLAFLLGLRSRAVHLVKYGAHLSHGLVELARSLLPKDQPESSPAIDYSRWGPDEPDDDSPYRRS